MNVARLNMSHGDHASHKAVVDKIKEYNSSGKSCIAIMLDTKVKEVPGDDPSFSSFLVRHRNTPVGSVALHCFKMCFSAMLQYV